jgi:hypothetical protein
MSLTVTKATGTVFQAGVDETNCEFVYMLVVESWRLEMAPTLVACYSA